MTERLNKPLFAGQPTYVQSIVVKGSTSAVFGGVVTINSGTATGVVTGVDVRSESLVWLGAPQFSTAANSSFFQALGVTSLTVVVSGTNGGFVVSTLDGSGCGTSVRIPWQLWRVQ